MLSGYTGESAWRHVTDTSTQYMSHQSIVLHDDVIKWKHFPRHWLFVRGIHRWPVNSPHKGQWRGALKFSLTERLSKQSWGWWFETPSCSLWRHCNGDKTRPRSNILFITRTETAGLNIDVMPHVPFQSRGERGVHLILPANLFSVVKSLFTCPVK